MALVQNDKLQVLQTDDFDDKRTDGSHGNSHNVVCGVGSCQPSYMQRCASVGCFTAVCSLAMFLMSTISIYLNSQITTLERQFGLSSSISGMLVSCNQLGYLLTTLPLSHLARHLHIPRTLALCALLFGLSGLLCTVPFLATRHSLSLHTSSLKDFNASWSNATPINKAPLCADESLGKSGVDKFLVKTNTSSARDTCGAENSRKMAAVSEDWRGLAVAFLAIGMILQGIGRSPRNAFIGLYIDDNVPGSSTAFHLGIISSVSILGVVVAYVLGGVFTTIYITLEDTGLSPLDSRWIGAWWLGFVVFGIANIVIAVPLVFFPRQLRPQPHLAALKEKQKRAAKGRQCTQDMKGFLLSVMRLLKSPVYMLTVLANCCFFMGNAGFAAFEPKYIEMQFFLPPFQANAIIGLVTVTALSLGSFIGGLVTSRFKFPPMKCLKFTLVLMAVCVCISLTGFVLGCDQPTIDVGITSPSVTNTSQRCQSSCQCDDSRYFPTCGADGVTYFSPCHAGCSENRGVFYGNCSCITTPSNTSQPVMEAVPGLCAQNCNTLYPHIAANFLSGLFGLMSLMPSFIVTIRSVEEADKPLAIGLSSFLQTLLGWLPAPVLFGRVVDTTCLLWSSGCAGGGSCSMYDLRALRHGLYGLAFILRVTCLVLVIIACVVASRMKKPFFTHGEDQAEPHTAPTDGQAMITHNTTTAKDSNEDETLTDSLTDTKLV